MGSAGQVDILANYSHVLQQIEDASVSVGRDPQLVKLVVVTKGHPIQSVLRALDVGIRVFGENYAEEGVAKKFACTETAEIEWHMIGHVQSRKVRLVCQHFDWVHSLDSLKLAQRFDRFAAEFGRKIPLLLECNVSGEESKFGWAAWDETRWEGLLPEISQIAGLPNLQLRGLMTLAPFFDDPEPARPYFQRLRRLQEFFTQHIPQASWNELSMGMSGDFTVAIQEGATMVRIGTAILGPRLEV
jgi:pyridoxal phosphate enzyme (YggS family)